jgi:hypothetical protein
MTMGELFAVAVLLSVMFALAALHRTTRQPQATFWGRSSAGLCSRNETLSGVACSDAATQMGPRLDSAVAGISDAKSSALKALCQSARIPPTAPAARPIGSR